MAAWAAHQCAARHTPTRYIGMPLRLWRGQPHAKASRLWLSDHPVSERGRPAFHVEHGQGTRGPRAPPGLRAPHGAITVDSSCVRKTGRSIRSLRLRQAALIASNTRQSALSGTGSIRFRADVQGSQAHRRPNASRIHTDAVSR